MKTSKPRVLVPLLALILAAGCAYTGDLTKPVNPKPAVAIKTTTTQAQAGTNGPPADRCDPQNAGPFDGNVLYDCVFIAVVKNDLSLLDEAKREDFVRKWKVPQGAIDTPEATTRTISRMISSLNELHTSFFDQAAHREDSQHISGVLKGGIGIFTRIVGAETWRRQQSAKAAPQVINEKHPLLAWPDPRPGTPAAKAGIKGGDLIVATDGVPFNGITYEDAIKRLRGKPGTIVKLTIRRPVSGSSGTYVIKEIALTREPIALSAVTYKDLGSGVAYLRVYDFTNQYLTHQLINSLYASCTGKELSAHPERGVTVPDDFNPDKTCRARAYVLELRGNGGGDLYKSLALSQAILEQGPLLSQITRTNDVLSKLQYSLVPDGIIVQGYNPKEGWATPIAGDRLMRMVPKDAPIVVLVDENSASASEIVAGLMQKNGRAVVVGRPTFGKSVGQTRIPLPFDTDVRVTSFSFKPAFEELGAGVIPDIEVTQSVKHLDDPSRHKDMQLARALTVAKQLLAKQKARAARHEEVAKEHEERNRKLMLIKTESE